MRRRAAGGHRAPGGHAGYVYSSAAILENYRAYDEALGDLPHTVCYAVKANSSLGILALLAKAGAGFDIVSGGELYRVLQAGGDASKVVFSGVGKTAGEVDYALASGIRMFNCESEPELALIDALAARRGVKAGFAMRVNPDVDAATHPYISTGLREHKFGIDIARRGSGLRARARFAEPGGRRRELPHRIATDGHQPDSRSGRTGCWRWSNGCARGASRIRPYRPGRRVGRGLPGARAGARDPRFHRAGAGEVGRAADCE